MFGECALCKKDKELLDSHIIPKFVFKWMKATGSNYMRKATSPNKRQQDGITLKLLCEECESRFNKLETPFSKEFFHPIVNSLVSPKTQSITSIKYNEKLYSFAISILWRGLIFDLINDNYEKEHYSILKNAAEEWRAFLYDKKFPRYWNHVYMWTLDKFDKFEGKPPKFDLYIMRSTDGTIGFGGNQLFIFTKMSRFIFLAPINGFAEGRMYGKDAINALRGTYEIKYTLDDPNLLNFLIGRVNLINEYSKSISNKQRAKIENQLYKEAESIHGSDLHRSMSDEIE